MQQELILEMKNITKTFPGVRALSNVDLALHKGEVLAVVGENGAGKSTMMNILLGSFAPDSGEIIYKGRPFVPKSPADALENGISMIHQELTLVPDMTVSENVWLGQEERFTKGGYLRVAAREKATRQLLDEWGIDVAPGRRVMTLTMAEMQLVEIARAVSHSSEVIIMDEPTSSLTSGKIDILFTIIRALSRRGVAVIYITHKLDEVFAICDNVMVMRDGSNIDKKPVGDIGKDEMITKMVGRQVTNLYPKETVPIGDVMLQVEHFTRKGYFSDISFEVRAGEILGFCGLVGAGRSEVMECLFGIETADGGSVVKQGQALRIRGTGDAIQNRFAMVTEDRLRRGLVHILSVEFNIALAYLDKVSHLGFVDEKQVKADCADMVQSLNIKVSGLDQLCRQLSGGNQQKVILAKWMLTQSEVVILDEPTRGIDVGAKAEIYKLIGRLAGQGKAVILVSSELPELMGISDRILVMAGGRKMAEVDRADFDENTLMRYAFGGNGGHENGKAVGSDE